MCLDNHAGVLIRDLLEQKRRHQEGSPQQRKEYAKCLTEE
jgi:hypothetical protein